MRGAAAYKLQQAARAFRSVAKANGGGMVSSTNRQGKGVPWAFSTGRQGKGVPKGFGSGRLGKLRADKGRVYSIRGFVPRDGGSPDLARFASARVCKSLGLRTARGAYFLVSPTGDRTLAVPGKYTLEDGSVLVV